MFDTVKNSSHIVAHIFVVNSNDVLKWWRAFCSNAFFMNENKFPKVATAIIHRISKAKNGVNVIGCYTDRKKNML